MCHPCLAAWSQSHCQIYILNSYIIVFASTCMPRRRSIPILGKSRWLRMVWWQSCRGGNNRDRGHGGCGNNSNNGGNAPKKSGSTSKPKCQICKIVGHEAPQCWYCYDDDLDDQQNNKTAGAANSQLWVRH